MRGFFRHDDRQLAPLARCGAYFYAATIRIQEELGMFLDLDKRYAPWEPPPLPPKPEPRLTPKQEKALLITVSVFLVTTFFAPIGGASVLQAIFH